MNLILKTKGSQPIEEKDKRWAEEKFAKLGKLLPEEVVVEVTLEDLFGPKGGRDKKVHVLASLPGGPQPFHLEEIDSNLRKAITTARDRFERHLKRYRDRKETDHRPKQKSLLDRLFRRSSA